MEAQAEEKAPDEAVPGSQPQEGYREGSDSSDSDNDDDDEDW
jgi:hypothetical protein